jgi:hypothetical protein
MLRCDQLHLMALLLDFPGKHEPDELFRLRAWARSLRLLGKKQCASNDRFTQTSEHPPPFHGDGKMIDLDAIVAGLNLG